MPVGFDQNDIDWYTLCFDEEVMLASHLTAIGGFGSLLPPCTERTDELSEVTWEKSIHFNCLLTLSVIRINATKPLSHFEIGHAFFCM